MATTYDRTQKNIVREVTFSDIPRASCLITLPGAEALCVEKMMEFGIIDSKTKQYWLERRSFKLEAMKQRAFDLGLNPIFVIKDFKDWRVPETFDLINLDLEETFTVRAGIWFENNRGKIEDGATILLTLKASPRNREPVHFHRWFIEKFEKTPVLRQVLHERVLCYLNHYDPSYVYSVMMLACALNNYMLTITMAEYYADGQPMMSFKAIVSHDNPAVLPSFSSLRDEFISIYDPVVMEDFKISQEEDYRQRAMKAVATRQANLLNSLRGMLAPMMVIEQEEQQWVVRSVRGVKLLEVKSLNEIRRAFEAKVDEPIRFE